MDKSISIVFICVIAGLVALVATTTMSTQNVLGIAFPGCISCNSAKDFAPGQEAKIPGPTCSICNGQDFSPGQLKKQTDGLGQ